MKKINAFYHLGFIVYFLGCSFQGQATHIVGGEITYECLGNDHYKINLVIFRDCDTGEAPFDNPASLGIFNRDNNLIREETMPLSNIDDTLELVLDDPCLAIPPNVCIHTTTYSKVIHLQSIPGGYQLAYQRCCRNEDIVNIVEPLETGATYSVWISEEALNVCNSSPQFKEWPPVYICSDYPISFDHSAIDAEGDSIVYALFTPLDGASPLLPMPQPPSSPPYNSVVWEAPFSLSNVMGGSNPLRIDPQTGLLTGTPTLLGTYVVGVFAREYRNGTLLSEIRRDFQYVVGICGRVTSSAFFTSTQDCDTSLVFNFDNTSQSQFFDFLWDFGDGNTSTFTFPSHEYQDTGTYTVTLIVDPNSACADTSKLDLSIYLRGIAVDIDDAFFVCAADTVEIRSSVVTQTGDSVTYTWTPDLNILSGQGTDYITVYSGADQEYVLTVENQYGCKGTARSIVNISEKTLVIDAKAIPSEVVEGGLVQLGTVTNNNNLSIIPYIDPLVDYSWASDPSISQGLNFAYVQAYPTEATTYYITAVNQHACKAMDSVSVTIIPPPCGDPYIFIPNAFTPNADGLNEILRVRGNNITEVHWVIYDRWGEKIFETTSLDKGWDGTYKGQLLPPDVYGYYLQCTCEGGGEFFKKGNVTLLR